MAPDSCLLLTPPRSPASDPVYQNPPHDTRRGWPDHVRSTFGIGGTSYSEGTKRSTNMAQLQGTRVGLTVQWHDLDRSSDGGKGEWQSINP
jgi:hypothetical protein